MGLLGRLRRHRQNRAVIDRLWDQIVSRARAPERFVEGGLPDTVMGRFESLSIEAFLALRRCSVDPRLQALSQDLVDRFMTDLDHSMRELGISYLAVPKRMRKLAAQFYTRVRDFEPPVAAEDANALVEVLTRTVYIDAPGGRPDAAGTLAHHMIEDAKRYAALSSEDILAGRLALADGKAKDES